MSYKLCIPPAPQDQTVPGLCFEPPSFYSILEDERAQEEDLERHPALQLRVILRNFAPKIWRRVLISKEATFFNLHVYLKFVMGWTSPEYSYHQFDTKSGKLLADDDVLDASINYPCWDILISDRVPLSRFLGQREDSVVYLYHSEDLWECDVIVEGILNQDPKCLYPRCIGGRGNGPPEGCGGVKGYKHLLEVHANPNHNDYHQLITDWLNIEYPNFDLNRFNARVVNRDWENSDHGMNPANPPILRIEQVQYRTRRIL